MSRLTSNEHVLLTLFGKPDRAISIIKQKYPTWECSFFPIKQTDNFTDIHAVSALVPTELWAKATILITLWALPPNQSAAPNLKYIHLFSAGVDHFKQHPILTTSIPITTSSGIAAPPIGEHIVMTLLSMTKDLRTQLSWQHNSTWGPKSHFMSSIGDWVGKTVGILGYGSIGRHAARILVAMGATVYAHTATARPTPTSRLDRNFCVAGTGDPEGRWPSRWFSGTDRASVRGFLASGLHALIVCAPLTPETRGLLGKEEFEVLQATSPFGRSRFDGVEGKVAGAFVVNIARGALVDQVALVDALKRRVIRAAALDVTEPEPLPADSELWALDNCIVTPHTSALGVEYAGRGFEVVMGNLALWEESGQVGSMKNLVKLGRGY